MKYIFIINAIAGNGRYKKIIFRKFESCKKT